MVLRLRMGGAIYPHSLIRLRGVVLNYPQLQTYLYLTTFQFNQIRKDFVPILIILILNSCLPHKMRVLWRSLQWNSYSPETKQIIYVIFWYSASCPSRYITHWPYHNLPAWFSCIVLFTLIYSLTCFGPTLGHLQRHMSKTILKLLWYTDIRVQFPC
jgi:hypothetical protein